MRFVGYVLYPDLLICLKLKIQFKSYSFFKIHYSIIYIHRENWGIRISVFLKNNKIKVEKIKSYYFEKQTINLIIGASALLNMDFTSKKIIQEKKI